MQTYPPKTVANYVIDYINNDTDHDVDNLKLQKLLYFILGHGLVTDPINPIFNEPIQKWKYGPVVESVYQEFKMYGPAKIDKPSALLEVDEKEFLGYKISAFSRDMIDDIDTRTLIEDVINDKAAQTGVELINETHQHAPWRDYEQKINSGMQKLEYSRNEMIEWFAANES